MTRDTLSRRPSFRLLTIAVASAALVLAAPGAFAEKHKVTDAVGDVVVFAGESDEVPAPDNVGADVIKSVTNHSAQRVTIKVRFVDLQPGDAKAGLVAQIKTNKLSYELVLFKSEGLGLAGGFGLTTKRGKTIKCAGKSKEISVTDDLIEMSVPRKCLGSPRWIKVGIGAINYIEPDFFGDDALRSGIRTDGDLVYGPKLKRG